MDLNRFIIDLIRKKKYSWLEERRLDLVPLLSIFLNEVLDGKSVLIITDEKRKWFAEHILEKINNFNELKPQLFPFFILENVVPQIKIANTETHFDMIEDMLNVAFEDYIFWYVGSETPLLEFTRRKKNSLYFIFDNDNSYNFFLKSTDDFLDIKLLHLADIVKEALLKVVFSEVSL